MQEVPAKPAVIVVMGVSGCGKSTVGALVAQQAHCAYYEGDSYHPATNIEKMQAGRPLTDEDRLPWLQQLSAVIHSHCASGSPAVVSCSSLKPAYRQILRGRQPLVTAQMATHEACCSMGASGSIRGSSSKDSAGIEGPDCALPGGSSRVGRMQVAVHLAGRASADESNGRQGQQGQQPGGMEPLETRGARAELAARPCAGQPSAMEAAAAIAAQQAMAAAKGGEGLQTPTLQASKFEAPCSQVGAVAGKGAPAGAGATAGVGFVLLEPSRQQLQRWVEKRAAAGGHFMPPSLLDSQLAALQYDPGELFLHFRGDPFPQPQQLAAAVVRAWRESC